MRKLYLVGLLLFFFSATIAQTKLNAVYAGIEFRLTINGTETFYQSYYFRPDGTYCHELNKPDWKTAVNGMYSVSGKKLTLVSAKSGLTNIMDIISDDIIKDNSTSLVKYAVMNQAPAQRFLQVSDEGQAEISFDGKGHFVSSGYRGSSMLNTKNDYDGEGTYTIKDSELTMQFANGKTATKSFFYSGGKTATALINGSTYNAVETKSTITVAAKQDKKITPVVKERNDGMAILKKANLVHGGKILDNLKTIKLQATAGFTSIVQLMDLDEQKIRIELYNNKKLTGIEQADGSNGWQWKNGSFTVMPANRVKEMQATFFTGILGLRSGQLKEVQVQSVEKNKTATIVAVIILGQTYQWIFDDGNRLAGEVNAAAKRSSVSKDFRASSGILIPFTSIETNNLQSFTINYSSIIINPFFSASDWSRPE